MTTRLSRRTNTIRACGPATAAAAGGCTPVRISRRRRPSSASSAWTATRTGRWTTPRTKAKAEYPGAFFSPAHIARLKSVLDQHPDAEFLKRWYLFSGKTEDAVRHAQRVIDGLKKPYGENNFFLVGLSNYRKSQFFAFVDLAEDALACPDLPPELRGELRRLLALYANVFSDPDANPRGAGVHLGNNNMPINRTLALSYFAGLLPDHPRYAYWMKSIQDFVQYKYATEMAVDGVNLECPSYALYSPFRTLNISQNILRNRGFHNFGPDGYHGRFLQWLSQLSMADPRDDGRRIIPGMGNSSNLVENVWGFSMAAQADHDAQFAGWLRFMNRLANDNMPLEKGPNYHDHVDATPHALYFLPDFRRIVNRSRPRSCRRTASHFATNSIRPTRRPCCCVRG